MIAICASVSVMPAFGGGMRAAGLAAPMRSNKRLLAASPAVTTLCNAFFGIEAKIGHAALLVGPVAGEAVVRQDWPHVAIEIDGLLGGEGHTR